MKQLSNDKATVTLDKDRGSISIQIERKGWTDDIYEAVVELLDDLGLKTLSFVLDCPPAFGDSIAFTKVALSNGYAEVLVHLPESTPFRGRVVDALEREFFLCVNEPWEELEPQIRAAAEKLL